VCAQKVKPGLDGYKMSVAVGVHTLVVFVLLSIGRYGTLVVIRPVCVCVCAYIYIYIVVNVACKIKNISHFSPFQWYSKCEVSLSSSSS
jgi:hypothetical protein